MEVVTIRGLKLKIYPRKALDVIQLAEYVRRNSESNDPTNQIFQSAMILSDSLKLNADSLPWWRVFRKWRIRKAVKPRSISGIFSLPELSEYSLKVFVAEGMTEQDILELKKKAETIATGDGKI